MTEIAFTKVKLPYGWLSNMSPFPVVYKDIEWRTTEALFQAMRFDDLSIKEEIRNSKSPMTAKMIAKKHKTHMVVKPTSEADLDNMRECVRLKVNQHAKVKQDLINTGDARIIEDVTNRGRRGSNMFWGALLSDNIWEGENWLGVIWMEIRNEIRPNSAATNQGY